MTTSLIRPIAVNVNTGAVSYEGAITGSEITDATVGIADLSATGTPSSSTYLRGDNTWATVSGSADKLGLTPTAVKTANYSASVGDFVPVDTTSGNVTVTFPTAPADGSVLAVKHVTRGGTNTITLALGGSDKFNTTSGATSGTITLVSQGIVAQYKSSSAVWYVVADDLPLSGLDARYGLLVGSNAWTGTQNFTGATVTGATITQGRPKGGGTTYYTVPGVGLRDGGSQGQSNNRLCYEPFLVSSAITLDQLALNVTGGGTSATTRVAIYNADTDWQPTSLVIEPTSVTPLDTSATGVKTTTCSQALSAGRYLFAYITSTGSPSFAAVGGFAEFHGYLPGTNGVSSWYKASAYGAMPGTGTAWDTVATGATGFQHCIFARVVTP